MNRDIAILRASVVKVTQMLAGMGLKVTQEGMRAFVESDPKTHRPVRVNIPNIPDNASEELILAIQGFVDHEVGHVLFTDWTVVQEAAKDSEELDALQNMVEDPFVEQRMQEKFPGSAHNVKKLHDFFLRNITTPGLAAADKAPDRDLARFHELLIVAVRALAGQERFAEFMRDGDHWSNPYMAHLMKELPASVKAKIANIRSSQEALDVARAIKAILYPEPPKGSGSGDGDKTTPSKSGSSREKSPDSSKSKSKSTSKDKPEAGEKGAKSKASADKDETDGEDAGSDGKGEDDADGQDGDAGSDASGKDDDAGKDDGADDGDGGGKGDSDGEEGDDAGSGGGSEDGEGDGDGEAAGDGAHSDFDDAVDAEEGDREISPDSSPFASAAIKLSAVDFDAKVSHKIGADAARDTLASKYRIYSRDYDVIEPYRVGVGYKDTQLVTLENDVRHMVGVMQKDVERIMASRSQVLKVPGFRSGRLHSGGLHRLAAGDDRVFRRRQEAKSTDTAVSLVVDCSGSMRGSKMRIAMQAAFALSQTLERVGINHECIGFTTCHNYYGNYPKGYDMHKAMNEARAAKMTYSRLEPLYMPIFKGYTERLTPPIKQRFADAAMNQAFLCQNIDGECVEVAANRLMAQPQSRKVLIVLSDGFPAGAPAIDSDLRAHLKEVVLDCARKKVEVIGIGIQSDAVKGFYPKYTVLNDIAKLPTTVMGEIKRILVA